jgi:hypothetical protein
MSSDPNQPRKPISRNPFLYTLTLTGIALLFSSYIMFSRWEGNRAIERRNAQEKAAQQKNADRSALEQLGGKDLAIQSFYAVPGIIHRGESAQLCYGVANAKTVFIDPPVGPVWPSYTRCLDVSPRKDTIYTLTIQDASGNTKSQSVAIKVRQRE